MNLQIKRAAQTTGISIKIFYLPVMLSLLLVVTLAGAQSLTNYNVMLWITTIYSVASLITYYFYWDDMRRAKMGSKWLISVLG